MAKQIKVDGQIHSFPDDATDDEINMALGGASAQPSLSNRLSSEISGAVQMPFGRSLRNLGQGAVDLAEFATNPAGGAFKALASKDIPYISALAKHWPQYPESDIFGLGKNQPGDTLWQSAVSIGSAGKAAKIAGGLALKVGEKALSKAPEIASKIGDFAPIFKSTATRPYVKQMEALVSKDLLKGYKPNTNDILDAQRILTSPGMTLPHEAVNEAALQALEGNYKPWFNLQSSVRTEARRLSKKGGVHNTLGDKLQSLADKMHNEMLAAQAERGAPEAAKLGKQGMERYARHHKIKPSVKLGAKTAIGATGLKGGYDFLKYLLP